MLRVVLLLAAVAGGQAFSASFGAPALRISPSGVGCPRDGMISRVARTASASSKPVLRMSTDVSEATGLPPTPVPGQVRADDLVKWLWTEAQFRSDYPDCSIKFMAEDIVYEDMVYEKPFVGLENVTKFLMNTKEKAPEDFIFVMDKCSDGEKAVGFTWHIELQTRPDAGKFANGVSFYELNDEGKICYIRDVVEPPIKTGAFGLELANVLAKVLKMSPPPESKE